VKILLCTDSVVLLQGVELALQAAGLDVAASRDPFALVPEAAGAGALLVDEARAGQAAHLLRDRGFAGRALLLADGDPGEAAARARELHLDGAVAPAPPEGLADRIRAELDRRRRVLVVDDSEIVARVLMEDLAAQGFEVLYAPDAERATSLILKRATRPDVILLDINMPKVDGAQFCRFVKRNAMFRSIKVVFCSAEPREKVSRLVEECGADGFISKDEYLGKWVAENG
jgi:CheY-like chemotaxis protein